MPRPNNHTASRSLRLALVVLVSVASVAARAVEPAQIEVTGTGWLKNRRLARSLERLRADPTSVVLDANAVEDAVFFLVSTLNDEGYLRPRITLQMTRTDGTELSHEFDADLTSLLPRPLELTRVKFEVERGEHYQFQEVKVSGEALPIEEDDLRRLVLSGDRAYSPAALRRGLGRVTDALASRGYAQARVEAPEVQLNHDNGEVVVSVDVRPGPQWWVRELAVEGDRPEEVEWPSLDERTAQPWTLAWEQDAIETVRQAFYVQGYPDVRVRASRVAQPPASGLRHVHVLLSVVAGPKVTIGPVRFEGEHEVKESVLRRRVRVEPGDPLNPLQFEAARYRLARLGAFRSVELTYEPEEGTERSPVFTLTELPEWEVHLLVGYGSYEQLRGGVEVRRNNVLGRAHQTRLELVQSFKSTRGELTYTVPELFGEAIDGSVQLFGLERDELAFVRQEFGGTLSLRRRRLPWINAEGSVSYTFQSLRNEENELTTRDVDTSKTIAASIDLGLTRDRRDSPLQPRRGYRWFAKSEVAAKSLGGDVDYQRLEFGVSYHTSWGDRRWIHAALTHGAVLTLGAPNDRELPVNRRFYPGGDSSIRGYQLGEAAPRGPDGRFLGAKSATLLNLEVEQTLVGRWTGVLFVDTLGQAAELVRYPVDEYLCSVGVGIRYNTIIGPLRLEYGYNLKRRPDDPTGTLHFSLGFPF
jgi:outer membrane protein insertion porin family